MPPSKANPYTILRYWHRWSGLIIAPFLLVVSLTGALLVFHDSIDTWFAPESSVVPATGEPVSIQAAIDQVNASHEGWVSRVTIAADSLEPWTFLVSPPGRRWGGDLRKVHYDPYAAEVMESHLERDSWSAFVTRLHRQLLIGRTGRIMVEFTTGWSIVSVILGIALWWPKKLSKGPGNWLPRRKGSLKVLVRDWHAVSGLYFAFFAIVFMLTGLFFSSTWGKFYGRSLMSGNAYFYQDLPASEFSGDLPPPRISADLALAQAESSFDFRSHDFFILIPEFKKQSFQVSTHWENLLEPSARAIIDAYSGESLRFDRPSDLPLKTRVAMAIGPTHVGSLLGWPGKIIAFLTCLVLTALALSGIWLWFKAPALVGMADTPFTHYPLSLKIGILVLAVSFPLTGISILAVWLILRVAGLLSQVRTRT